jgi:hypothetical protein
MHVYGASASSKHQDTVYSLTIILDIPILGKTHQICQHPPSKVLPPWKNLYKPPHTQGLTRRPGSHPRPHRASTLAAPRVASLSCSLRASAARESILTSITTSSPSYRSSPSLAALAEETAWYTAPADESGAEIRSTTLGVLAAQHAG